MSKLIKINQEYSEWIILLSQKFKQSQIKAATHVNIEMLKFYWSLGQDIVTLHAESKWGSGFIHSVSADLKDLLPDVKGLSETSIGYAKRFYILYNQYFKFYPQVGGKLADSEIWRIPWGL